jgi:hypothetical protein
MDALSTLALVAGIGWASGVRLYAVVFFLGLLQHTGLHPLPDGLEVLAHPAVLTVSGTLFLAEFCADKIPGFDTLWDAAHTFVRIPGGAILAALAVASGDPGLAVAAALLGGVMAAGSHFTKTGLRALINTSPEPVTNWTASLGEDLLVPAALWTALVYPLAFLAALFIFVALFIWLLPRLVRGARRLLDRLHRRRTAGPSAAEPPAQ